MIKPRLSRLSRLGALGLLLFVAPFLFSAEVQKVANLGYNFDLDSTTTTYVRVRGANGDPFAGSAQGPGTIKTTAGPSATVTENVASTNPFRDIVAGDIISVARSTTITDNVVVIAKASDASITVDPAVTWDAGFSWRFRKTESGTGANDGWVSVEGGSTVGMTVQYDQGDLDALKVRFECRGNALGSQPVILYPGETSDCGPGGTLASGFCEFTTPGVTARITIVDSAPIFSSCRIGIAVKTTDTSDAGANLERIVGSLVVGSYAR